jgi:hypothetical protein
MPQSFIACDRDQQWLLPPSLLDWVPEDHLVWTVLSAVEELDLSAFYADYRADVDLTRFGGHVGAGLRSLLLDHL